MIGTIGGVDFSGAKTVPNDTWLVTGDLSSLGLTITAVKNTGSHALAKALAGIPELKACGMDFPFSLPVEFLRFLERKLSRDEYQEWQHIAEQLVFMSFEDFEAHVKEYDIDAKRYTDKISSRQAKSPIHQVNPCMVPMTYHGIRMLAGLDPGKFFITPFQDEVKGGCEVLEVYPREILWLLGLPDRGYKGKDKKAREKALALRKEIVDGMIHLRERGGERYKDCPRLTIDKSLKGAIIATDHALDALAACYAVAIKILKPELFPDPLESDNLNILLEGWMYAPSRLASK